MTSIIEHCGLSLGGRCGYCKGRQKSSLGTEASSGDAGCSCSLGVWAHSLHPADYQALLNAGWRRSGKYVYKPLMDQTCCPQYTIRLDSNKFFLSRSQRRVLRQMNDFLKYDKKPKSGAVKEEAEITRRSDSNEKLVKDATISSETKEQGTSERPVKKKRELRRERCIAKWIKKGLNVEEMQRQRREMEENRRSTIKSMVLEHDKEWKHELKIQLVSVGGSEFKQRAEESYQLYAKYQSEIHSDKDSSPSGYKNFLVDSPLTENDNQDDQSVGNENCPPYGSYHQWYILDDKLIAVGVVDILPGCVSSKYMYYDPDYSFLSIGTYTALREIEFTQRLSEARPLLKYYYMGYYITTCPKMRYKGKFQPSELLCDKSLQWAPLSVCQSLLDDNSGKFTEFYPSTADRMSLEDLSLLVDRTKVRYRNLRSVIPNYARRETEELKGKLDLLVRYLPSDFNTLNYVVFVNELQELAEF